MKRLTLKKRAEKYSNVYDTEEVDRYRWIIEDSFIAGWKACQRSIKKKKGEEMKNGIIELNSPFAQEIGFLSDKFGGWLWKKDNTIIISFIESKLEGQGKLF